MGPQAPPARRSARLVAVAAQRAGPSCGLPGQAAPTESRGNYLTGAKGQFRTSVDTAAPPASARSPAAEEQMKQSSMHYRTEGNIEIVTERNGRG